MRILFLSGWYPYPPDNGSKIRILNIIKQLATDHEITLLSLAHRPPTDAEHDAMRAWCHEVRVAPHIAFEPHRLRALLGLISPRPRSFADTYSRPMADLVHAACAARRYDLVIASQIQMAPYALLVDGVPRLLEELELTTLHEQAGQGAWPRRMRYTLTWVKTARFARELLSEFSACTVVSSRERSLVARIAPDCARLAVVPNGVDLAAYAGDFGAPEPNTLIHTGALSYRANYDAVAYLLREIYPLIRRRAPVTLRITGATDGLDLDALSPRDGAIFTGYLPDIRPAIARSWVSLVPLRIGGGTRLKILEAMALGTPVVATSKGAEGLDVTDGENILLADTPACFANAVLGLLGDPTLRARLAARGRRLVSECYGWDHIGAGLRDVVRLAAGVTSALKDARSAPNDARIASKDAP